MATAAVLEAHRPSVTGSDPCAAEHDVDVLSVGRRTDGDPIVLRECVSCGMIVDLTG